MDRKSFLSVLPGLAALSGYRPSEEGSLTQLPPFLKAGDIIGFTSPAGYISLDEVDPSRKLLNSWGYEVRIGDSIGRRDCTFGGTDEMRLVDLQQMMDDPKIACIMCARGGYGSNQLLRYLDAAFAEKGTPSCSKLIIGSSDATSLLEFARTRWGFTALHSAMPGLRSFYLLAPDQKAATLSWAQGIHPAKPWGSFKKLKLWGAKPASPIRGTVVGGNLTVWNTMLGTPRHPRLASPSILFLEDVTETLLRLDRSFRHLADAGGLDGVKAIVLGNFLHCEDAVPSVIGKLPAKFRPEQIRKPPAKWVVPLRKKYNQIEGLKKILEPISHEFGIPLAWGLPVGHGPEQFALPIGAQAELGTDGAFKITSWDWKGPAR